MWNLIPNRIKIICGIFIAALSLATVERVEAQMSWANTNYSVAITPQMAAYGSRGVHVHDPSAVIKCGDEYWVFSTAWRHPVLSLERFDHLGTWAVRVYQRACLGGHDRTRKSLDVLLGARCDSPWRPLPALLRHFCLWQKDVGDCPGHKSYIGSERSKISLDGQKGSLSKPARPTILTPLIPLLPWIPQGIFGFHAGFLLDRNQIDPA